MECRYVLVGLHLLIGLVFAAAKHNLLEACTGSASLPFGNLLVLQKAVLCKTKTGSVDVISSPLRKMTYRSHVLYEVIRKPLKYTI